MLLINPNLPRVRLELGVLYYRLGSYEVARTYLEGALKSPTVPPDVRSRAEQFMAQIENQQQSPSHFHGEAVPRLALPVERQSRPGDLERAAVRPGRQPQPVRRSARRTGAS